MTQIQEIYIGQVEVLAIYLKRFFPGFFTRLVRNFIPK